MFPSSSSDFAVLGITLAFFSLLTYAVIHSKIQAKKDKEEQKKNKS